MITHVIAEPAFHFTRASEIAGDPGSTRASAHPRPCPAPGFRQGRVTRGWVWLYRAYARAGSRQELRGLPEELLRDIGLTQADVARECAKPFWR